MTLSKISSDIRIESLDNGRILIRGDRYYGASQSKGFARCPEVLAIGLPQEVMNDQGWREKMSEYDALVADECLRRVVGERIWHEWW